MKTAPVLHSKILLINRNRDGLLVRGQLLEELGYRVAVAQTSEEGLTLFEASSFDLVVADYRLPRINGIELTLRIRKIDPQARVILLSGQVEALNLTTETTAADAVLAKSAGEPAQLARTIKRLLNRPALRKPPASQKLPAPKAAKTAAG
jgi:CheY-like chemotaxis protein